MASCPYCSGDIKDDLLAYGGNCPHCFNKIQGEEEATDPGAKLRAKEKAAEEARKKTTTRNTVIVFSVLLLAIGGAAGFISYKNYQERKAIQELLSWDDGSVTGGFGTDWRSIVAEEETRAKQAEEEAKKGKKLPPAKPKAVATGPDTTPVVEEPSSDRFAQNGGDPVVQSPKPGTNATPGVATPGAVTTIGTVKTSVGSGKGVLSSEADIQEMVVSKLNARYSAQVKNCYNDTLKKDPDVQGSWTVAFTVEPNGATTNVKVQAKNKPNEELEGCITRQVKTWQFDPIAQQYTIAKTYRLQAGY